MNAMWRDIPDNYDAYKQHEADQARELNRLPRCANCDEPITADHFYEIEGVFICPDCLDADYRRSTDDYIE